MRKKRVLSKADILAYLELLNVKLAEQGLYRFQFKSYLPIAAKRG